LHIADEELLLSVLLVLVALLFVRDLHRETETERIAGFAEEAAAASRHLVEAVQPPEAILVGPRALRSESTRFARDAQGDMVWFHVCLSMFKPQPLFDAMLRPAIENPRVTSIQFVLDSRERETWDHDVLPKVEACA